MTVEQKSKTPCRHSTVVVHPTCNRKVVGSNPTAGLQLKTLKLKGFYFIHNY